MQSFLILNLGNAGYALDIYSQKCDNFLLCCDFKLTQNILNQACQLTDPLGLADLPSLQSPSTCSPPQIPFYRALYEN